MLDSLSYLKYYLILMFITLTRTQPNSSPAEYYLPVSSAVKPMYKIPDPQIQVYDDIGFEVSIPDEEGIKVTGFHGNINVPLTSMLAGQINEDVLQKSPNTGRWIYVNKSIKLKPGDVIYFWLYVLKHNMAYMKTNQKYIVTGFQSPNGIFNSVMPLHPITHKMTPEVSDIYHSLYHCQVIADNTLESLVIAHKEISRLRHAFNELKYAGEKTSEVYYHAVILGGFLPQIANDKLLDYINYVIRERLRLYGIEARDAFKQKDGTILFDLRTKNEKQRVLEATQKFLVNENIHIKNVNVQYK